MTNSPLLRLVRISLACCCLLLLGRNAHAQSVAPDSSAPHFADAYGLRIGIGSNADEPSIVNPHANPIINPYYETRAGNMALVAELYLTFVSLEKVGFPSYNETTVESYGFHALVRNQNLPAPGIRPFFEAGFGFDVYRLHVSATVPIMIGGVWDLSNTLQLEVAGRASPLVYFGGNIGFSYGATAGIRLSNYLN